MQGVHFKSDVQVLDCFVARLGIDEMLDDEYRWSARVLLGEALAE